MKVVKRVIVGVLVAALAAGGIYTGLMHVKESKVTEVPVTSVGNLQTDWYSETTLDGTITTNVSQNINMDKDMIIDKIYVSQGDNVKKGDNLISFDMTLVEMELNIAKLKLQKQEQDLTKAQNRLTSLQNGGPIEDSTDSTDDTALDSVGEDAGTTGTDGDGDMTNTDPSSDSSGDDDMQSTTGSAAVADGSYLAAAFKPLLLSAFTDTEAEPEEEASGQTEDVPEEVQAGGTADSSQEQMTEDTDQDPSDNGLVMNPDYQDSTANDFTDGEDTPEVSPTPTPEVSPTPTPTLAPDELPDPDVTDQTDSDFTDGEAKFYQKLDYTSVPFTGTGTEEDPYIFLVSSAKGKVTVMGSFFNKMAGYSEDGTKVVQPGGSWFQLEFHENDTIADFQDRTLSCTGYYLIDGSLLEKPVYMYAETEFTLEGASRYDNNDNNNEIPDDSGDGTGDDSTDSTTMSRDDAIKIQKNKISSLKLDIEESNLNITKLENKVKNKLVTSKLDGTVAYIGDRTTGSYNGDAFLKIKSKDGFYVTGTVSELMRDQMKEGTALQCTSYDSGSFEAKVLNVSDYPVDSSNNNFYYGGDSNPNVSYYTFNAEITDRSLQFADQDYVTISLKSNKLAKGSLVVMKAFIRTENGTSYVYKDVKGTLKKQQVTVGSIVNSGYYAIVTSGLKSDDLLAFPYGSTVQEGAKTKEVTLDDMYNE